MSGLVNATVIDPEFLGSSIENRLGMCKKLAAEAELLASEVTNPETASFYRDLKRQWDEASAALKATITAS